MTAPTDKQGEVASYAWPKNGPDFNRWNADAARFVAMVQGQPYLWLHNPQLKYLDLRIDTRNGNFVLFDRDNDRIDPEIVQEAVAEADKQFCLTRTLSPGKESEAERILKEAWGCAHLLPGKDGEGEILLRVKSPAHAHAVLDLLGALYRGEALPALNAVAAGRAGEDEIVSETGWTPAELAQLMEMLAVAADRHENSYTETAALSRKAAFAIRALSADRQRALSEPAGEGQFTAIKD